MGLTHTIGEKVFSQIHGNHLVYNTCWEDPRCDRNLLNFNNESRIVMLTSAGCNALDYLLDNPAHIHCVDMNPRQNALLQLKVALFQTTDHATLFDFFGTGSTPHARKILDTNILEQMPDAFSRFYWQRNWAYFNGKGLRPSFYWHGSSGMVAWLIRKWMQTQPQLQRIAKGIFEAQTIEAQRDWYEQMEPRFLNPFVQWLMRQHFTQSMLGVPKSQQGLASAKFEDGMVGYVRHCLRQVFTRLSLADNYFWYLYFFGRYTPTNCPNYLLPAYFDTLRERSPRIQSYTASLSDFLRQHPGQYTHFILLDHQDWLAAHLQPALDEEWRLILDNAAPEAQVLMRSASFDLDFLPDFAKKSIVFNLEAAQKEHELDRVGTYASTWVGRIH
jgi:S-adenosylmethionine-diacylglycerol 3-amino-3-carboxypropyl transferase